MTAFKCKLSEIEHAARILTIVDISDAVHCKWPHASTNIFGSFPENLSIFLSDLDFTISTEGITGKDLNQSETNRNSAASLTISKFWSHHQMSSDERLRYENVSMALASPTSFDMRPVQGAVSLTSETVSKKDSSSQQV